MDGVGKTTIKEELRRQGFNVFKTPPDQIAPIRSVFETQGIKSRFMYYLLGVVMVGEQIDQTLDCGDVFCDRYLLCTVAAHEAMGLNSEFLYSMMPVLMGVCKPELTFLLTATEEVRLERLSSRPGGLLPNDISNFKINNQLLEGYRVWSSLLGHKLLEIDTTEMGPLEVVDVILDELSKN